MDGNWHFSTNAWSIIIFKQAISPLHSQLRIDCIFLTLFTPIYMKQDALPELPTAFVLFLFLWFLLLILFSFNEYRTDRIWRKMPL